MLCQRWKWRFTKVAYEVDFATVRGYTEGMVCHARTPSNVTENEDMSRYLAIP